VETYFYDIRKQLFDYDAVLNSQREKLYFERRRALAASGDTMQAGGLHSATLQLNLRSSVSHAAQRITLLNKQGLKNIGGLESACIEPESGRVSAPAYRR
jgi:preprotein translocase subunit SecA